MKLKNFIYSKFLKLKYKKMITTNLTKGTKLVVIDNKSCHNIPLNTKVKYSDTSEGKIYVSRDGKIFRSVFL